MISAVHDWLGVTGRRLGGGTEGFDQGSPVFLLLAIGKAKPYR